MSKEFKENLEDLEQWAVDLEEENGSTAGLLAWACFELREIQTLKAKLKAAEEGLEHLVVQFKKDADDSFDDPAACAFLDCAAEAAKILQEIKE